MGVSEMTGTAPWLQFAQAELGTREAPGAANNPAVLSYYGEAGHPNVVADDVAWCAAFVGAMLARAGYPLPPANISLLARSYLTYGIPCDVQPGAIGIWPRGTAWQGHVGFVLNVDSARGTVDLLAGNQGDAVSVQRYPLDQALAFRWPVLPTVAGLRKAGSTEIRTADRLEVIGVGGAAAAAGGAAAAHLFQAPVEVAPPVVAPDAVPAEQLVAAAKAVWRLILAHPWLVGCLLAALALFWYARKLKARRVARAKAGSPLSSEVL